MPQNLTRVTVESRLPYTRYTCGVGGQSRLSQFAAAALSAETFGLADHIIQDVERFRRGPPTDDMTLIVVEMK